MSKDVKKSDIDYLPRSPEEVKELIKKLQGKLEKTKTNRVGLVVQADKLRNLETR